MRWELQCLTWGPATLPPFHLLSVHKSCAAALHVWMWINRPYMVIWCWTCVFSSIAMFFSIVMLENGFVLGCVYNACLCTASTESCMLPAGLMHQWHAVCPVLSASNYVICLYFGLA